MNREKTVLFSDDLKSVITGMVEDTVASMVQRYTSKDTYPEEWNLSALKENYFETFGIEIFFNSDITSLKVTNLNEELLEKAYERYKKKEEELSPLLMRQIEKMILLRIVDREWKDHLKRLDDLKQGIGLRAYGQKDPLIEYHFEAHNMFQNMIDNIKEDSIKFIYRVKIQPKEQSHIRKEAEGTTEKTVVKEIKGDQIISADTPVVSKKKIGRNDPCPCGSGQKYKYCCGKEN